MTGLSILSVWLWCIRLVFSLRQYVHVSSCMHRNWRILLVDWWTGCLWFLHNVGNISDFVVLCGGCGCVQYAMVQVSEVYVMWINSPSAHLSPSTVKSLLYLIWWSKRLNNDLELVSLPWSPWALVVNVLISLVVNISLH